jgi:hypothetical protein
MIAEYDWERTSFARPADAWARAAALLDAPLDVLGDYVVPPADGAQSRDFQTLHVDFGLPLNPIVPADLARFTALHIPASATSVHALTRLVPLAALLAQRSWAPRDELVHRLTAYGTSHGAWADSAGYSEGSFARIVEATSGMTPVLPSVRAEPEFLCGTEFATLAAETRFFAARGLAVDDVTIEVDLRPGQLLVFDNLAVAHGRRGTRAPGELHQRIFGHRAMPVAEQLLFRDRWLTAFGAA